MNELQGMVRAVVTTPLGAVASSWVGNQLSVFESSDFPRDGGQFTVEGIDGTVFTYTAVAEGEFEDDPDILTTVETAPAGLPGGDEFRITLFPGAVRSVAEVAMAEALDDSIPATIPHTLKPYLADGVRDPENQESVLIAQREMEWVVVDILGQDEANLAEVVSQVDEAREEILQAHDLISQNTAAAQDAHNEAVLAQQKADAADDAAYTAQTMAEQAGQAAATAAGIAGAKADVLIQPEEPGTALRKPSTLWIDTSGGSNTPKRWDGSSWAAVTDKAAVDAAAAAAAAQSTASSAASAAAAAQDTADQAAQAASAAQSAASNAQSTATSALTSANGRNSRVTSTSPPSGTTNPNTGQPWVDGDTWWQWNNVTNRNVIGAWVRRNGAWVAEMISHETIVSVDVNTLLVSGSARIKQAVLEKIVGDAAYFKVLTADKILVQPGTLYYDGTFGDPGLSAVRASNGGWTYNAINRTMTGNSTIWLTYEATDEGSSIPYRVGQKYLVRVTGTNLSPSSFTFALKDPSRYVFIGGVNYTADGMEAVFEVLNPQTRINLYSQNGTYTTVSQVEIMPMVGSTIIEPGAVDTPQLKATAIDGMTVTGATIRTAASGARVELTTAGLKAYNSSGTVTSEIYGASGSFVGATFTGGTVRTSASGARVQLSGDALSGYYSTNQVAISLDSSFLLHGSTEPALVFRKNLSSNWVPMVIRQDGLTFLNPTGTWYARIEGDGSHVVIRNGGTSGDVKLETGVTGSGAIRVDAGSSGGFYTTSAWTEFKISGPADANSRWVVRPITTGGVTRATLQYSGGNYHTTSLAANLMMDANGTFYKSTSAQRYKADIRDIGVDPYKVLNVPVRDWIDRTELDSYLAYLDGDEDSYFLETPFRRIPGVVAEELETVGLSQFVTYDTDGQTSGVLYDRLALLLIPVVRELRDRINQLEGMLT